MNTPNHQVASTAHASASAVGDSDLHQWESDMRRRFWSRELQQPKGKKPAELLLTAVCQHLHEVGGITYAEIAKLVLGDTTQPDRLWRLPASRRVLRWVFVDEIRRVGPSR